MEPYCNFWFSLAGISCGTMEPYCNSWFSVAGSKSRIVLTALDERCSTRPYFAVTIATAIFGVHNWMQVLSSVWVCESSVQRYSLLTMCTFSSWAKTSCAYRWLHWCALTVSINTLCNASFLALCYILRFLTIRRSSLCNRLNIISYCIELSHCQCLHEFKGPWSSSERHEILHALLEPRRLYWSN